MSAATPCQQQLQAAIVCLQFSSPGECGCFEAETFPTTFEENTRAAYLSSQAFASPSSPDFCDISSKRVCDFYNTNQSCCCQIETETYRRCLVETVFPLELPRPVAFETTTCQNKCDVGGNDDGGSSTGVIAGAIVGVALLAAIGAYFYRRRRRANSVPGEVNMEEPKKNKGETKSKGDFWNNKKGSSDDETHPQDLAADQSFVDDQDLERGAPPNTERPPVAVVSTRNLIQEADAEMAELELKAEKLRSKREAIENWHNDKKKGSNRSLDSYMSDEDNLDDEEKERRRAERRARREAKRASIREKERAEQSAETPLDPPVRRSSSRSMEGPDGGEKMRRSSSKGKLERKSSRTRLSDTDDRKERSSTHKEERSSSRKKERSSSRSRLNDP